MPTKVIQWSDNDYAKLENGIHDLVKSLHRLGIMTVFSCEGHIRTEGWQEGILPWPWVIIQATNKDTNRLLEIISDWNCSNPDKKWILSNGRIHGSFTPEYIKFTMMREHPGTLVRAFVPMEENLGLSTEVLAGLQKQVPILAQFLAELS